MLVVAQPAPIENYIPLGKRKSRVYVLNLRSGVSQNEGKKETSRGAKLSVIAATVRNNQQRRGGNSYKEKDKKGRKVQKKGKRGEDSVLAQISVLVMRSCANEEEDCSFLRGFSQQKVCEKMSSPRALAESEFAKGGKR